MLLFRRGSELIHYYLDIIKTNPIKIKIEKFQFDFEKEQICVNYRLGTHKICHRMFILDFESQYYEKLSSYDRHRLTIFSTFQHLINEVFNGNQCKKIDFLLYIQKEVLREQLF